jgi:hypothetical protein
MSISSPHTTSLAGMLDILNPQKWKEKKERERQEEALSQKSFFDKLYADEHPQTIKAQLRILYHVLLEQGYDDFGKLFNYLKKKNEEAKEQGKVLKETEVPSEVTELIEHFLRVLGRVEELEKNTKNGNEQRFVELEQHFAPLLEAIYEAGILGYCDFLEDDGNSYGLKYLDYRPVAERVTEKQKRLVEEIESLDKKIRGLQESLEVIKEKSSPGGKSLFYQKTDENRERGTELTNRVQKSIRDLEDKKKELKQGLISSGKQRKKEYLQKRKDETLDFKEPEESGMSEAVSETEEFDIVKKASRLKNFHN